MRIVLEASDEEWLTRVIATAIQQGVAPAAPAPTPELMTLSEAAEHTRVPENTLRYWRTRGAGGPPSHKRGRRIYYSRTEVDAWIASEPEGVAK